jgi:hypothetical protein
VLGSLACFPSELIWNYGSCRQSVGSLDGGSALSQGRYPHRTTETQKKRGQTSMPRVGSERRISVFELAKNIFHALDRAADAVNMQYEILRLYSAELHDSISPVIHHKVNRNYPVSGFGLRVFDIHEASRLFQWSSDYHTNLIFKYSAIGPDHCHRWSKWKQNTVFNIIV